MTYFKYTSGESFLLDGIDYTGFLHTNATNQIFTGKSHTVDSVELTPKNTYLSDVYKNKLEFNTAYLNVQRLNEYYPNVFDNLNNDGLLKLSEVINTNNLISFKSLIIDNPNIYNFDITNNHLYALPLLTDVNQTLLLPVTDQLNYDNFKTNIAWGFLDNIKSGEVIIDNDDNFKYICSTGLVNYILSGSFTNPIPLTILQETNQFSTVPEELDYTYNILHDEQNNRILFVNKDYIKIYDSTNFSDCNKLFLIDKIKLTSDTLTDIYIWNKTNYEFSKHKRKWSTKFHIHNENNPEFIKFGNNLRTSITKNILRLSNKYSSDIITNINLELFGVGDILSIDIRENDDHILILNKKLDGLYVLYIDITNITESKNNKLESISIDKLWYRIKFSNIDSDIYHVSNDSEYQTRHISYNTYPTGRINSGNLLYVSKYKWSEAVERYNIIDTIWNAGDMLSNYYNNILSTEKIKNDKMYLLLHNKGRIYTISQNVTDRYYKNVDLNILKYFNGITCSETSIGIYINNILSNMIKDTLNLHSRSYGKYIISEFEVSDNPISDIDFDSHNFYINGNETLNVLVFRRILSKIFNIQNELISIT